MVLAAHVQKEYVVFSGFLFFVSGSGEDGGVQAQAVVAGFTKNNADGQSLLEAKKEGDGYSISRAPPEKN